MASFFGQFFCLNLHNLSLFFAIYVATVATLYLFHDLLAYEVFPVQNSVRLPGLTSIDQELCHLCSVTNTTKKF